MGDVAASNNKLLHTNFDKDIDYYKISRKTGYYYQFRKRIKHFVM